MSQEPTYFRNAAALRRWFARNAATSHELIVGFYKTSTGKPSITWPESVDEALCVGWIDGVRHRIDEERYKIRFTPRKPGATWSSINIDRVSELEAEGRMQPAGRAVFEKRSEAKSRTASYEQGAPAELGPSEIKAFKKNKFAWVYYETLPKSYRNKVIWWIITAKQEATRERRLGMFIEACAQGRRL